TNYLDPRSYYALRGLLEESAAQPDVALVTTWMMGLERDRGEFGRVAMPFNVNNVDLSVSSNFLYGLVRAVVGNVNGGAVRRAVVEDAALRALARWTGAAV